jgi:hypothetical protein
MDKCHTNYTVFGRYKPLEIPELGSTFRVGHVVVPFNCCLQTVCPFGFGTRQRCCYYKKKQVECVWNPLPSGVAHVQYVSPMWVWRLGRGGNFESAIDL